MFVKGYDKNSMISFKGPITIELLSIMGNYLKIMINAEQVLQNRVFKIFIELTQNVSYYSAEVAELESNVRSGVGWFMINEYDNYFNIKTGNLILRDDGFKLTRNCDEINSLNELQLRELKRKTRGQAKIRDIGAHIGLIQTSLFSKNKLDYNITELDLNHSFFTISVNIDK